MEQWIVVRSWDKFQHYKDRQPVWIKLYLGLLDSPDFRALTPLAKALLLVIWLLYARANGPFEVQILRLYMPVEAKSRHFRVALERLNHAGFIEVSASKPLAQEKRREEKKERASKTSAAKAPAAAKKARAWIRNGLADQVPPEQLEDVLADEFKISDPSLLKDLVAQAREHQHG